jgi:hypothetical protein
MNSLLRIHLVWMKLKMSMDNSKFIESFVLFIIKENNEMKGWT